MTCDYPASAEGTRTPRDPEEIDAPRKRRRQLAVTDLPTPTASESEAGPSPLPPVGDVECSKHVPYILDTQSLELLHYYMCHTSTTLGDAQVFRDVVPALGFKHDCVLRMILSITARHLTRIRPDQAPYYHSLADDHAAAAFPEVTAMLTQVDEDNSQALYYATVLICLSSLAREPSPGNLLVVAEDGEVPWWALMRGVRIVLDVVGINRIMADTYKALLAGTSVWEARAFPPTVAEAEELQWERALAEVASLVADMFAPDERPHNAALGHLRERYEFVFGGSSGEPLAEDGKTFTTIFAWLFLIEEDFVSSLETGHPAALLLLAYYGVLLRKIEHHWFMAGWPLQIVTGVSRLLDSQYVNLLQWPMEQVGLARVADEPQL
ncbi:C6 zinc finger protein [Colletotrichum higginsianum IMI 349063]|uniref:C6 zinc finger protein n=2 Tax=Colletotrichum higginsianum TaxID=80884 RepID=A0A1B7YCE1_COLHI|nr:C6 zinc finger protein [Colletotrichum higginsianum IMI 349063]OBR09706.1 C6 zinc finger protein [Colletotrichum higginsianum IMI 349063]TID06201.1 hypothetical protein CH35J_001678 [Colletotrichum higginsianum]